MIRKFIHEKGKKLGQVLFSVCEVPQASTGFSPFELLYGRQPRRVLDVLRETGEEGPSDSWNEIQYVIDWRTKLHTLRRLSIRNLLQAQERQIRVYNRGTKLHKFAPGEKVLVLLPTSSSKLLAKWQGPFEVTRWVGELNYEVVRTDRSGSHQKYNVDHLKKWNEAESVMLTTGGERGGRPQARSEHQSTISHPGPRRGPPLTLAAHWHYPVASRVFRRKIMYFQCRGWKNCLIGLAQLYFIRYWI